jgi:tetratricopeptide (TPR) repeat protein
MVNSAFAIEQARLAEARQLPGPCHDDFLRLSRTLIHGPPFQWLLVEAPDEGLRRQVMAALDRVLQRAGLRSDRLPLSDKIRDVPMLEARLVNNARQAPVVHVIGRPGWFDAARWEAFNTRRERLAADARARLVFWLDGEAIALASRSAPDLWAWRGGVYSFLPAAAPGALTVPGGERPRPSPYPSAHGGVDTRSMAERSRRVVEIRAWLESNPEAPDELRISLVDELGLLLFSLGDLDEALSHRREVELPLHRRLGDSRSQAITMGRIADILEARGQLDEALRIRQEAELPVYERLGDVRSKAITMGKSADILQARGQLDEALRIHQEEALPVFERLGDVRSKAITMGRIADILEARGQLDEALRIRQEEEISVYERLGDVREKAITMGKIADILQAQGQLDEALRIRQEEEISVYERLGDVREKAITMGKIADILQARGQLDEALRIRQEEELPVFERLGDMREKAITMAGIAEILQARGQLSQALQIYQKEVLPMFEHLGDDHAKAVTMVKIADILQARGQEDQEPPLA